MFGDRSLASFIRVPPLTRTEPTTAQAGPDGVVPSKSQIQEGPLAKFGVPLAGVGNSVDPTGEVP